MKVLVYTASSLCNPQFGIQMERAMEYYHEGNEVLFCYCDGVMHACSANPLCNPALCKICRIGFKSGLKKLPQGISVVGLKTIKCIQEKKFINFKSIQDIKNYQYKEVEVGFSVMSVYITKTRNPNPNINEDFIECVNKSIKEAENFVDSIEDLILKERPDLIVFFNGRFYDTKPLLGMAKKYSINFLTTENVGGVRAGKDYRMVKYYNTIPHDAKVMYNCCLESWNKSARTEKEKIKIGESFYEKRRNGQKAGDYIYTGNQIKDLLPKSFDSTKKNVVIFCSSEDEYSSVTSDIDKMMLFKSQYEGIKYIIDNIGSDDYYFYVRIHPNMQGLDFDYHKNLYKLEEYSNVTVIPPEDPISTYALMDAAYNIVVFGSTVGAESLFWGKPIVLLGFAEYYYWNCFMLPHDKDQVVEMVMNPVLYPYSKEIAIKYGYFFLENSLAEKSQYVNITPKQISVGGKKVFVFDYLKILGSVRLYRYIHILFSRVLVKLYNNHICFPDKIIN